MNIQPGYLYFISDSFFQKVSDPYLKQDHISTKRPHYFAYKDLSVYIKNQKVVSKLEKNAKKVISLIHRGVKFTPTQPDILRIEK